MSPPHVWTRVNEAADVLLITDAYRWAHVPLEDVRLLVKSGFADPQDSWGSEPQRQLDLARGSASLLARRFREAGIGCVIDDAIFPSGPEPGYPAWSEELRGVPHGLVVLLPTLEAIIERNHGREGNRRLAPEMLTTIYEMMTPWRDKAVPIIDNSDLSVTQTILAIETALSDCREQEQGAS